VFVSTSTGDRRTRWLQSAAGHPEPAENVADGIALGPPWPLVVVSNELADLPQIAGEFDACHKPAAPPKAEYNTAVSGHGLAIVGHAVRQLRAPSP